MHHAFIPDNLRALNHREVINEKSVALPRGRDILLLETDAPQLSHCAYLDDVYVPCARDLVSRSGCMRYRRSRLDRDARAIGYPCTDRVPLRLEIVIVLAASGDSQGLRDDVHEYLSGTTKEERVCSQWSRIAREDDLVAGFDARHECDWTSLECCGGSVSHLTRA
ncbi:hypothetical protein KXW98_004590 [Aspergillus fumigatus]|nr:hypothetical protein CNMCM8714_003051 [Aspergillus fumigatus]KAF4262059.1 hypothetical protein CNMCM8057_001574 [Aspergillus fumigatus]KAF4264293.1 hypothetical protein CNMCM8812_003614 [Aspergillus fumigatus]KAF4280679.1 hypothetical protein CNMCM8689_001698 [Aspergillus fumigatus]KAF4290124.1 hypothetical protein CNMCM8686_001595 [Aspergillus fumigatus]